MITILSSQNNWSISIWDLRRPNQLEKYCSTKLLTQLKYLNSAWIKLIFHSSSNYSSLFSVTSNLNSNMKEGTVSINSTLLIQSIFLNNSCLLTLNFGPKSFFRLITHTFNSSLLNKQDKILSWSYSNKLSTNQFLHSKKI